MVQLLELDVEAHRTVCATDLLDEKKLTERSWARKTDTTAAAAQILEHLPVQHLSALSGTCRHFRTCVLEGRFAEKLW